LAAVQRSATEEGAPDGARDGRFAHRVCVLAPGDWHRMLEQFRDANLFQTIAFGRSRPRVKLEHFALTRGTDVVAVAQVQLVRVPLLGRSIAYILWGPLCQPGADPADPEVLGQALRRLRWEYVERRGISLRIRPQFADEERVGGVALFRGAGYRQRERAERGRTMLVDLRPPLADLRRGLDQKWRNCLNKAEKSPVELIEGEGDEAFALFVDLYREMVARKRFAEAGSVASFRAMQHALPTSHRLRVIVARVEGQPSAGAICSAIGARGIYLFGATSEAGLRNKASYVVQWRILGWLKEMGCTEYDLHGVNRERNPGVYAFKAGLSGRNGREVEMWGSFDASRGRMGDLTLQMADWMKVGLGKAATMWGTVRGLWIDESRTGRTRHRHGSACQGVTSSGGGVTLPAYRARAPLPELAMTVS
jgi:lipid II:glycine glycyltransferase (peptidoglycan interpeptide bridge formation enzyme)